MLFVRFALNPRNFGFNLPAFRKPLNLFWVFLFITLLAPGVDLYASPSDSSSVQQRALKLSDLSALILNYNEGLFAKLLEHQISQKRVEAEKSIYEPDFVASYERQENKRRNNAEQQSQQIINLSRIFVEKNNVYNAGLEGLVPMGGKVRLGYSLRDLENNLQPSLNVRSEFQSFAGVSLTQPLLKNFGRSTTLANLRLAALASDVAFEEYRRQLMLTLSTGEGAYWNLYLAQEQGKFFKESVALATTVLRDASAKFDAGKGSPLEVMEAQSALSLRQSRLVDAEQRRFEAMSRLTVLFAGNVTNRGEWRAIDEPELSGTQRTFQESAEIAIKQNPDYQAQRSKLAAEDVRLAYARNQRLPQLDLKASYGLNGLAETLADSTDQLTHGGYPAWSAGVELRIPLAGGIRSKRELEMARLKLQQVFSEMKELEVQMYSSLETTHQKIFTTQQSVTNYQQVVTFNENLLKSQLQQLEAGRIEPRKVLEVEADLLEARSAALEAVVLYRRALLELELIEGSFLRLRNLEVNRKMLKEQSHPSFQSTRAAAP